MQKTATVWILGNQLLRMHPALKAALADFSQDHIQVLMIESQRMINLQSAHPDRLVLVVSAMRHYTEELRSAGYQVDYRQSPTMNLALHDHLSEQQPSRIYSMASTNIRGRHFQESFLMDLNEVNTTLLPNTQFLVEEFDPYPELPPDKTIRQETFYRRMRERFRVLMDDLGQPLGGQWNYDQENRQPLPTDFQPPLIPKIKPDALTNTTIRDLGFREQRREGFSLAVDHQGATQLLEDFISNRLAYFGTYQDAMSSQSSVMYHSLLSPYLNLGLLDPLQVIRAAEAAHRDDHIPLNSAEGFIRQILGWREYIYWQYWRQGEVLLKQNYFCAQKDLPDFFWTGNTKLNCLQHTIRSALDTGYNHHIERLMVISNYLNLIGVQPQQALDWFLASYLDAYPWVMVPNLIGMGLYADGGRIGSKPYIASANYINKMSDYCQDCWYHHQHRTGDRACPYNFLYWNFLFNHQDQLKSNPRMNLSLANLNRISPEEAEQLQKQSKIYLDGLIG